MPSGKKTAAVMRNLGVAKPAIADTRPIAVNPKASADSTDLSRLAACPPSRVGGNGRGTHTRVCRAVAKVSNQSHSQSASVGLKPSTCLATGPSLPGRT